MQAMRYFICPSPQLPRLCTIAAAASGFEIVWTVFDFMEAKNSLSIQTEHKPTVDGFVSNVLIRLQKFQEVDEAKFDAFFQLAAEAAARLARSGTSQTIWTPSW